VNQIQIQETPVVGDEKFSICPSVWHGLLPICCDERRWHIRIQTERHKRQFDVLLSDGRL